MSHIVELQHKLTQNRLEANSTDAAEENIYSQIRARTARRNIDIDMLLKRGSTPCQVSQILGIPIGLVQPRVAELDRDEEERREFMQTMRFPERGGYLAIFR
jgi:hypothetical protein